MADTQTKLEGSVIEKLRRLLGGEIDELTVKRKPSGKIHVEAKTETSHEAHEAPCG